MGRMLFVFLKMCSVTKSWLCLFSPIFISQESAFLGQNSPLPGVSVLVPARPPTAAFQPPDHPCAFPPPASVWLCLCRDAAPPSLPSPRLSVPPGDTPRKCCVPSLFLGDSLSWPSATCQAFSSVLAFTFYVWIYAGTIYNMYYVLILTSGFCQFPPPGSKPDCRDSFIS